MKKNYLLAIGVLSLSVTACATNDRLFFVEKTHFGLRAELEPESQTPGNIHFGYKRSLVALIPCKNIHEEKDTEGNKKEVCGPGNNQAGNDDDILSIISSFQTRVTWFQGTRIQTFFATGDAATKAATNVDTIKALSLFPKKVTEQ